MTTITRTLIVGSAFAFVSQFGHAALAYDTALQGTAHQNHAYKKTCNQTATYWQKHPKVKSAAVGAGVGTAAGALTGLVTHKGVMRGAVIGAGAGAGVGLIHESQTMKRHPIVKDVAEGTAVATALGLAAHRGPHEGKHALQLGAVGGAAGLGVGLLKNLK
jgi:hypothetical protein